MKNNIFLCVSMFAFGSISAMETEGMIFVSEFSPLAQLATFKQNNRQKKSMIQKTTKKKLHNIRLHWDKKVKDRLKELKCKKSKYKNILDTIYSDINHLKEYNSNLRSICNKQLFNLKNLDITKADQLIYKLEKGIKQIVKRLYSLDRQKNTMIGSKPLIYINSLLKKHNEKIENIEERLKSIRELFEQNCGLWESKKKSLASESDILDFSEEFSDEDEDDWLW